jgi:hypothetical protein
VAQRGGDAGQRGAGVARAQPGAGALEDGGGALRSQRKAVLEVADAELAGLGVPLQHQLAALEHPAVGVAEHRQHHLARQPRGQRVPVDVEVARVARGHAVLEHVGPPGVVVAQHPHVIGHQVDQLAHAVGLQRLRQALERGQAAELGIDLVVGHDVVAVHAAGAGAVDRRAVDVADAQPREVGHDAGGVVEAEAAVQLQPVGGARQAGAGRRAGRFAWPAAGDGGAQPQQRRPGPQVLRTAAVLALPIGMLEGGAGQVGLLDLAERVLQLRHHHARGRRRQEGMHGRHRVGIQRAGLGRRHAVGRQRLLPPHGVEQAGAIALAVLDLLLVRRGVGNQPELEAQAQVMGRPPARERRQVVGADRHHRLARPGRRRPEGTVGLALEVQQPVRLHAAAAHGVAHGVRHGAQVLADHQAAMALAFQGQDGHQLVDRIGHVAAVARRAGGGDPEQAHQHHHVVDADRAGAAHVGAQGLDEDGVPAFAQPVRAQRRQAPVLALGVEGVGRRAHAHVEREAVAMAPGVRAAAVDRDREVEIEADRHPEFGTARRRRLELPGRLPLQVGVVADALGVCGGEGGDGGAVRIATGLGPGRPAPDRGIGRVQVRLQRLEQRVLLQGDATALPEQRQRGDFRIVRRPLEEAPVEQFQHLVLGVRDAVVVDRRRRAQAGQPGLEGRRAQAPLRRWRGPEIRHCLDIDVERVELGPRRGAVRTLVRRVVREQRVQGIQPDHVGARAGGADDEVGQIAEIAEAPVALRTQRMQLQREAPEPAAALQPGRLVAACGRADQQRVARLAVDAQAVVADGQRQRERKPQTPVADAVDLGLRIDFQGGGVDGALVAGAAFVVQPPFDPRRGRRQLQHHAEVVAARRDRLNRGQGAQPGSALGGRLGGGGIDVRRQVAGVAQQRGERFGRDPMPMAEGVVVAGRHAVAFAETLQRLGLIHRRAPRGSRRRRPWAGAAGRRARRRRRRAGGGSRDRAARPARRRRRRNWRPGAAGCKGRRRRQAATPAARHRLRRTTGARARRRRGGASVRCAGPAAARACRPARRHSVPAPLAGHRGASRRRWRGRWDRECAPARPRRRRRRSGRTRRAGRP